MLVASRLSRRFDTRIAVEDVSFTLERGEIFALLGPNGAGKTTTLRMLAGLIAPTSGDVTVEGERLSPANAARLRGRIGFLTEAPGLWDRLTVRQNLSVYASLHGVAAPGRAVDEALDAFGVLARAQDQAAQLSKGLKQRVALARTLLHKPDFLLLDEPTSGLDPESARDVREMILLQRQQGRAVLLSTHNLAEVGRVADRVAVMRTRMLAVDTPAALRARLFGSRVRIVLGQPAEAFRTAAAGAGVFDISAADRSLSIATDDGPGRTPAIVRRLVAAGAEIESVIPEERSLEEVYLRLLEKDEVA
jgi:ABC-2 type transport system ATP-binding protein